MKINNKDGVIVTGSVGGSIFNTHSGKRENIDWDGLKRDCNKFLIESDNKDKKRIVLAIQEAIPNKDTQNLKEHLPKLGKTGYQFAITLGLNVLANLIARNLPL